MSTVSGSPTGVGSVTTDAERHRRSTNAMRGAFLGFFVDMFDIYLPIVVLAPAMAYFVSPDLSAGATSLVTGAIFAATLVGRPLGAMIFGHYADSIGRKRATIVAVSGFGILTVMLGLMPGYEQWGVAAIVIFIVMRFVIGIFVGGEYTAASPLAMEYSPKEKRGLNGGLIMTGFPLAFVAISLLTLLMLQIAPAGGVDSAYVQWGWRIPFFMGGLLALAFVVYFHRTVTESELFTEVASEDADQPVSKRTNPIIELLFGASRRNFWQVFILMTGFWLSLNTVSAILPGTLRSERFGLSGTQASLVLVVAFLAATGGYIVAAQLSQRFGRRPFLIWWGIVSATVGTGVYALLLASASASLAVVVLLATITVVLVISNWGLATVYINERFHTGVRASGFGLGYSLAVVIPSFYAFYQGLLGEIMSFEWTALPLLVIGALLITVGAALGPETRDVDFEKVDKAVATGVVGEEALAAGTVADRATVTD